MAFNPLGSFDPGAPLDPDALAEGKAFAAKLPSVPAGSIDRIYAHWTVGHYGQDFSDYNGSVRFDTVTKKFSLDIVGDPRDNARGHTNPPHSHTFHRNTGAFGISTDDMIGANEHNFGPEPLTMMTLEFLCAGIAAAGKVYGIDANGTSVHSPYAGEPNVLTHAEAADRTGSPPQYAAYGPASTSERWDLASFVAFPAGLRATGDTAKACGDALRQRAHLYKVALQ